MSTKRIVLSMLCAVILLCVFSGCKNNSTDENSIYELNESVEVEFWYGNKADGAFWKEMIKKFNALSDQTLVTVIGKEIGSLSECTAELNQADKDGKAMPAMITLSYDALQELSENNILSDITGLMKAKGVKVDAIINSAIDQVTVGEKIVGMPWNCTVPVYYYNRTELKKHGLDVFPSTWEEFKSWTKDVYEATGVPAVDFYSQDSATLYQMLLNFGGDIRDKEGPTKTAFKEEAVKSRLKELVELIKSGYIGWQKSRSAEEIAATWMNGEVMSCYFPAEYYTNFQEMMEKRPADMQFEIGLSWNWGDANRYGMIEGSALCVMESVSQKEKNGAGVFIEWLMLPENRVYWAEYSDSCMVYKEDVGDEELLGKIYGQQSELITGLYPYLEEQSILKTQDEVYEDVMNIVVSMLGGILYQEKEFDTEFIIAMWKIEQCLVE